MDDFDEPEPDLDEPEPEEPEPDEPEPDDDPEDPLVEGAEPLPSEFFFNST